MAILSEGAAAPSFTLKTDSGSDVSLAELTDKPVVLFFYPKDDTPGCTIECKEFRDAKPRFEALAYVFGISPDDVASHQAFRDKYALNFPLLSDQFSVEGWLSSKKPRVPSWKPISIESVAVIEPAKLCGVQV